MVDNIATEYAKSLRRKPDFILLLLCVMSVLVLFYRFRFGSGLLAYYHDDFFYYLKIVDNVIDRKGVTFDGAHRTNGFHPLYFVFLACLRYLAPGISFFVCLQVVITSAVLVTYMYAVAIVSRFTATTSFSSMGACCIAYFALIIMRGGMEIVLAIPLACSLIYFLLKNNQPWQYAQYLRCALLMSAVMLARLDTCLLVLLLCACIGIKEWQGLTIKKLLFFAAGLLPVLVYAILNVVFFSTIMPVSGQAKQLRTTHFPSSLPFRSIFIAPFSPTRTPFVLGSCAALFAGIVCLWRRRSDMERWNMSIMLTLLIFPILHLAYYSIVSDWRFFPWYLYPLVLSSIAAAAMILPLLRLSEVKQASGLAVFLVWATGIALAAFSLLLIRAQKPEDRDVYANALDIKEFAKSHPGTYAMGDCAGSVGYLLRQPVIQLEGLVEDEEYLNKLKRREPLREILNDYKVTYYVGSNPVERNGCYEMTEPLQGGLTAYKVHGTFCSSPVMTLRRGKDRTVIFAISH